MVGLVRENHIIRTCLMYHAACKVEFQPFKRSYSQLTFFYNVITTRLLIILYYNMVLTITTANYAGSVYHVLHEYRA